MDGKTNKRTEKIRSVGRHLKSDIDMVLRAWERCKVCQTSVCASEEAYKAYRECEYTTGLYCRQDKLIDDTIEILKEVKRRDVSELRQREDLHPNVTGEQ